MKHFIVFLFLFHPVRNVSYLLPLNVIFSPSMAAIIVIIITVNPANTCTLFDGIMITTPDNGT